MRSLFLLWYFNGPICIIIDWSIKYRMVCFVCFKYIFFHFLTIEKENYSLSLNHFLKSMVLYDTVLYQIKSMDIRQIIITYHPQLCEGYRTKLVPYSTIGCQGLHVQNHLKVSKKTVWQINNQYQHSFLHQTTKYKVKVWLIRLASAHFVWKPLDEEPGHNQWLI